MTAATDGDAAFFSDVGFFGFLASRLDLFCPLAMTSSPALIGGCSQILPIYGDAWPNFPETTDLW
jgi:hypothetical protein